MDDFNTPQPNSQRNTLQNHGHLPITRHLHFHRTATGYREAVWRTRPSIVRPGRPIRSAVVSHKLIILVSCMQIAVPTYVRILSPCISLKALRSSWAARPSAVSSDEPVTPRRLARERSIIGWSCSRQGPIGLIEDDSRERVILHSSGIQPYAWISVLYRGDAGKSDRAGSSFLRLMARLLGPSRQKVDNL